LLIQILICFGLGLLPGLDNFSHLGGFAAGLLLGLAVLSPPPRIRARLENRKSNTYNLDAPYTPLTGNAAIRPHRSPIAFFQHRKKWWWIWNLIRVACLVLVIVFMALLFNNFYVNGGGNCS